MNTDMLPQREVGTVEPESKSIRFHFHIKFWWGLQPSLKIRACLDSKNREVCGSPAHLDYIFIWLTNSFGSIPIVIQKICICWISIIYTNPNLNHGVFVYVSLSHTCIYRLRQIDQAVSNFTECNWRLELLISLTYDLCSFILLTQTDHSIGRGQAGKEVEHSQRWEK